MQQRRPIPTLLTLAAVARRLDLPYMRVNRLVRTGALIPDALAAGGISLFKEASVARVEATLRELKIFPIAERMDRLSSLRIVS